MKASDLRIGNLYYYRVLDQLDPKKEWFEVSKIDYDDLRVIAIKDEMNQDYQPIPLNEEWLLKFLEVKKFGFTIYLPLTNLKAEIHFEMYKNDIVSIIKSDFAELILDPIKYVHQLQNLYFALTGTELIQK